MVGRIVRQGRWLGLLILAAVALTPSLLRAQDVIVFPPSAATAITSAPTPIPVVDAPAAATEESAPLLVREPPPMATTAATSAADATPASPGAAATHPGVKYAQCTTDADCVLMDDGCKSAMVANQRYIADANAGMAHDPACRPAAVASLVGIKATCRDGICALLPGRIP
jgi:hypothetical protein